MMEVLETRMATMSSLPSTTKHCVSTNTSSTATQEIATCRIMRITPNTAQMSCWCVAVGDPDCANLGSRNELQQDRRGCLKKNKCAKFAGLDLARKNDVQHEWAECRWGKKCKNRGSTIARKKGANYVLGVGSRKNVQLLCWVLGPPDKSALGPLSLDIKGQKGERPRIRNNSTVGATKPKASAIGARDPPHDAKAGANRVTALASLLEAFSQPTQVQHMLCAVSKMLQILSNILSQCWTPPHEVGVSSQHVFEPLPRSCLRSRMQIGTTWDLSGTPRRDLPARCHMCTFSVETCGFRKKICSPWRHTQHDIQ